MCARFGLKIEADKLRELDISVHSSILVLDEDYLPYKKAAVIVQTPDGLKLTPMIFSLVPSWSKEPRVKFATHNARIETITEKPAWREPFATKHCIVPMTYFCESVYEGPHAGHVISFGPENSELLFAAGIFDVWVNPETKEQLYSFAIITKDPSVFILENGHDRTPIFLKFEDAKEWLNLRGSEKEMVDFLLSKNVFPDLSVTRDRPLKPGWEKRI